MRHWWFRWREVVYRISALTASIITLLGFALPQVESFADIPWWGVALAVVFLISLVVLIVLELQSVKTHQVYDYRDVSGIRDYMHGWIRHGGRVAIWTRDMSWAHDDRTQDLLKSKAEAGELIICLPKTMPLTQELEKLGAEICAYGTEISSPASRFTIAFFGRDGAQVAVGRSQGRDHIIDEFNSGEHPVFYIAEDLVKLAREVTNGR